MIPRYPTTILALSLLASVVHAEGDAPKPPVQTLAQALALAAPPKSEIYITVDAEKVTLPENITPAASGDSVTQVATVFGRRVGGFGNVDAIAPATITVVNVPPDKVDPYDGMEPEKLIQMLSGSFSADQWKEFMSETGVGYSDLTTSRQRALFAALFPDQQIAVQRFSPNGSGAQYVKGDALKPARLRLAYKTTMALSLPAQPGAHMFSNDYFSPDQPTPFIMTNSPSGNVDKEYGATVCETIPNTLKANDLGADDAALRAAVSSAGLATVDKAVRAIAAATGREIYADPRYAKKTLTVIGPSQSVRALDLMRALALCVGGTYRKVGSAYVLTDDLVGLGAKHQLWKEFEEKAKAAQDAGEASVSRQAPDANPYTIQDIPWTADSYPLTQSQQDAYWKKWREDGMEPSTDMIQVYLPFAKLTPAQQEAARKIQEQNTKQHEATSLDGDVMMQAAPMIQIVIPSLDAPVLMLDSLHGLLPTPKATPQEQAAATAKRWGPLLQAWTPPRLDEHLSPIAKTLTAFARRAVRAAPHSTDELTKDLAAMKALGINELWLAITPGANAQDDASVNLLGDAVKQAKAAHIAVYPDLSLLAWGDHVSDDLIDRAVTGRTTTQQNAIGEMHMADVRDTVTPFDPEVGRRLAALLGKLANVRGIAGVVWENAFPLGYARADANEDDMGGSILPLGYAVAGRLAFLRKEHADPIDLHNNNFTDKRAHVSVPGFDDDFKLERSLYTDWRKLRSDCGQGIIRWLAGALPSVFAPGPHRLSIIVPPSNTSLSVLYGSWDNLTQPPPGDEYTSPVDSSGQPIMGAISPEHMPSALVYRVVPDYMPANTKDESLDRAIAGSLRQLVPLGERGVVFDAIRRPALLTQLRDAEAARAKADAKQDKNQK
ncbi:MAG: hypothetical protein ABIY70_26185 [Capsulimonas sp.]|uniref:hypothetical protein n=1 Tax=Capsulimonas sp. TaxID=2494211 RepID=UPI003266A216